MAIRKNSMSYKKTSTSSSKSSGSVTGKDTGGNSFSIPTSSAPTATKSVKTSTPAPTRYTNKSSSPAPSSSSTFGFMDGSSYNSDGSQVAPAQATPAQAIPSVAKTARAPIGPTLYNGNPLLSRPTGPALVDEAAIRETTRKRMQSQIDAIDANYAILTRNEEANNTERLGETRAVNARSGLVGSDFGQAQTSKTQQFNSQQLQSIEAQKQAQVASVMDKIEQRASEEISNRKQEALGQYDRDLNAYREAQEAARDDFKKLASSGVDLATLSPAQKAALFKQAGYDENMGELIYNAMKPKAAQIDYKSVNVGNGRVLFYGADPVTGELKQQIVDAGIPDDWSMTIAPDGTAIGFNKNTGETTLLSGLGQFAKTPEADTDKILTPAEAKALGVPYGTTQGQAAQLGITPKGELSAEAQKLQGNVQSGLRALGTVKKELFGDENKDLNQPGDIRSNILFRQRIGMAREYDSASKEIKDILVRLRTGAAISENEEKYYTAQLPVLTDNESTIRSKLRRFEELFNSLVPSRLQTMSSPDDLFNQFEGGSEGTNPKATTVLPLSRSANSVNTKTLASVVLPKYAENSIGGQCVTFLHRLADFPPVGDSIKEKFASVDKFGIPRQQVGSQAKVGMILITNENKQYGHGAMINAISADGKYARVTESNFKSSNRVSHDRVIALNDSKIYGAIIPKGIKTSIA